MTKTTSSTPNTTDRMPIYAMIVVAVIILAAAVGGFVILYFLPDWLTKGAGTIVILLVAGVVSVMLLLYLGTMILRTAGLATRKEALGMPEGSIRALIAMSLILMFAIIGVTILYAGMGTDPVQSNGITAAELDKLENVQIISITVVDPAASPGAERFNVTARPELSPAGHDFGLQLLTTVSTLVVAVAGFYFGSRAVSQGAKSASEAAAAAAEQTATLTALTTGPSAGSTSDSLEGDTTATPINEEDLVGTVEEVSDDGEGAESAEGAEGPEEMDADAADGGDADADSPKDGDAPPAGDPPKK